MFPIPNPYRVLKIRSVHEELKDFKTIVFEEGHGIEYKPGQYLTLIRFDGEEEIRRSYSFTSCPSLNEPMTIGVKRIPNGAFSRFLVDHAKPGDEILTSGAGGIFTLPDKIRPQHQFIFFAAGSGITPVFSMVKSILSQHPLCKATLIYSSSSPEQTIFLHDLNQLKFKYPGTFSLIHFLSNNQDLLKARLNREFILDFVKSMNGGEKSDSLFYLCGPENYMRLCSYTLILAGVPADNVRKENFIARPLPKMAVAPPDKNDHNIIIKQGEKQYSFTLHYPDTILKAARKAAVLLPYSCETGRCGNCVARCTSGKVWHSYNEVLTDKDLQDGLVLTCVGHPLGGDVVLELH